MMEFGSPEWPQCEDDDLRAIRQDSWGNARDNPQGLLRLVNDMGSDRRARGSFGAMSASTASIGGVEGRGVTLAFAFAGSGRRIRLP